MARSEDRSEIGTAVRYVWKVGCRCFVYKDSSVYARLRILSLDMLLTCIFVGSIIVRGEDAAWVLLIIHIAVKGIGENSC